MDDICRSPPNMEKDIFVHGDVAVLTMVMIG